MTKKLDKEHVEAIQSLQDRFTQNAGMLGRLTLELKMLQQQQQTLQENEQQLFAEFSALREEESQLIENLKARYGDGQINITEGTFTPAE